MTVLGGTMLLTLLFHGAFAANLVGEIAQRVTDRWLFLGNIHGWSREPEHPSSIITMELIADILGDEAVGDVVQDIHFWLTRLVV